MNLYYLRITVSMSSTLLMLQVVKITLVAAILLSVIDVDNENEDFLSEKPSDLVRALLMNKLATISHCI
jgi:uncharacterized membrane protein